MREHNKEEFSKEEHGKECFRKAQECLKQQDVVGALALLTQAISETEDNTEAYLLRGQILYSLGDKAGAEADMQKVLELDPGRITAVNGEFSTRRDSCH